MDRKKPAHIPVLSRGVGKHNEISMLHSDVSVFTVIKTFAFTFAPADENGCQTSALTPFTGHLRPPAVAALPGLLILSCSQASCRAVL